MAGVSTRKYGRVIGEMADTVGVSKSAVSRETVEASERVLKELMERQLDAWDLLVIYLDGIQMGSHHVLAAVGVDSDGKKHVLGVREGASENVRLIARSSGSRPRRKHQIQRRCGGMPKARCRKAGIVVLIRSPFHLFSNAWRQSYSHAAPNVALGGALGLEGGP